MAAENAAGGGIHIGCSDHGPFSASGGRIPGGAGFPAFGNGWGGAGGRGDGVCESVRLAFGDGPGESVRFAFGDGAGESAGSAAGIALGDFPAR